MLLKKGVTVNRPGLDPNVVLFHFVAEEKGFVSPTPETLIIRSSPVDISFSLLSVNSEHDRKKLVWMLDPERTNHFQNTTSGSQTWSSHCDKGASLRVSAEAVFLPRLAL